MVTTQPVVNWSIAHARTAKAADEWPANLPGAMLQGLPIVARKRTDAYPEMIGGLLGALALQRDHPHDVATPLGKIRECPLERLEIRPRFGDLGGPWGLVGDPELRIDLGGRDTVAAFLAVILRNVERRTEDVIRRLLHLGRVRDALQPLEGLVQRFVREVGRPQTPRQVPDQRVVIFDELPPELDRIRLRHFAAPYFTHRDTSRQP